MKSAVLHLSDAVQRRIQAVDGIPLLQLTEEASVLARALLEGQAVPPQAIGDAFCLSHTYAPPVICTPEELSEDTHNVEG